MSTNVSNKWQLRLFPFIAWFPITMATLQGDILAGIVGGLVLVPKAMAYAQLSGLPVYFGLYTALVPAILGALWGSSRQLATGPVAIVSLMTAAAVSPLALPFSEEYIGLALLLSLLVGIIQLVLGLVKLGVVVNFVSHPVILGFMNAAAIIIALSQVDMLLGIPKGNSHSFLMSIWETLGYVPQTHLPTLAMSVFALLLMLTLKHIKVLSKPSVLIAVVITTMISSSIGFESKINGTPDIIATTQAREQVATCMKLEEDINSKSAAVTAKSVEMRAKQNAHDARTVANLHHEIELLHLDIEAMEHDNNQCLREIRMLHFKRTKTSAGRTASLYLEGAAPANVEVDGHDWHIKKIGHGEAVFVSGGDVVGKIPAGLPSFRLPTLTLDAILQLLAAAIIVSLVAFMECISMAKAMAAKSKQRLDPNQELIGQGIANIGGAFFQSYPACGSFTGSAINLQAGAKTGLAMVANGLFVAITLLFLTPYLYHLPKAVLAVIILLAVTSLITPKEIKHTWAASTADGIAMTITFIVTLLAAPHLDKGILIGATLAILLYLYRTMKPRVAILGRFADGTLRDIKVNPDIPTSPHIIAIRFDGSLYFANVSYFEDSILEAVANKPQARYLLVVGDAINQLDASGEGVIHQLVERMHEVHVKLVFSGLKKQVLDVMRATGLFDTIGQDNIFATEDQAITAIRKQLGTDADSDPFCLNPAQA